MTVVAGTSRKIALSFLAFVQFYIEQIEYLLDVKFFGTIKALCLHITLHYGKSKTKTTSVRHICENDVRTSNVANTSRWNKDMNNQKYTEDTSAFCSYPRNHC